MSAGEHEAVEVDVSASEFVDAEADPDADPSARSSSTTGTSRRGFMEMLTSTTPRESPEAQDGSLSTNAAWYQHAELFLKKATGAEGTPAWVNGTMAALTLAAEAAGVLDGDRDQQAPSDGAEGRGPAEPRDHELTQTENVDQSGRPPTAENGDTSIIS